MFCPVQLPIYLDREFGLYRMTAWLDCGACTHRFKEQFVMGMQSTVDCPQCGAAVELGDSHMSGPFDWPEPN